MKNFVLVPNVMKDKAYQMTQKTADFLLAHGAILYAEQQHADRVRGVQGFSMVSFPKDAEAIIVLGGDGSMIEAAALALEKGLPIIGINLGKLGYLASVEPNDLEALQSLLTEVPTMKEHIVLRVALHHADGRVTEYTAVNDAVVMRRGDSGLAQFSLSEGVSCETSLDYYGDGLIVCTPLGSTAYSLSAGGPIIDSGLEAVAVTPICVHSFFSRSILFSPETPLRIANTSDRNSSATLTIDGHNVDTLMPNEYMTVTVPSERLRILSGGHHGVLDALRKKMMLSNAKN